MNWITKTVFSLDPANETMNERTGNKSYSLPDWCSCRDIWKYFGKVFDCGYCTCCTRCRNMDHTHNCFTKICYCCCECHCGGYGDDVDLENKKLPHNHRLLLRKEHGQWYCGVMKLNMKRIGIYLLLCGCIWCASVAFFEAVILSYGFVSKGDTNCPTPKYGTSATVMDCFIFQNVFDTTPINKTSSIQCNGTVQLSFSGFQAGCFAWIYNDVDTIDVIEELGICAGIIAMLGTVVIILCYLCRDHRWRLFFEIVVCCAIAAIPTLLYTRGNIPFIAYILLGTLCGVIIITEYILEYAPLFTWLCLVIGAYKRIKKLC